MKFVIVGCGRAGSRLAQTLSTNGHRITVVDNDEEALARLAALTAVTPVLGIGFDRDVLLKAGIQQADGLAAATGVDEVNVVVARMAKQIFRVPRVVARVFDPRKADIYRRLGLFTVSPLAWGVDRMAEALVRSELTLLLSLGSGDVNVVEFDVTPLLAGRTAHALTVPGEIHVTAVHRGGRTFLPGPETQFQDGDRVYLTVTARSSSRLEALLKHG